jgi:putative DNA primase/helicase
MYFNHIASALGRPESLEEFTARVRDAAKGSWPEILAASGISSGLLKNCHGPCPGCGGRDRFRFDDREGRGTWICSRGGGGELAGDGFALLEHTHGWPFAVALREVARALRIEAGTDATPRLARTPVALPTKVQRDPETARSAMQRTLRRCRRIQAGGPVARYLEARGLGNAVAELTTGDLLECAALLYFEGGERTEQFPALVAIVRDPAGEPVTLHRTYLTTDGQKANVRSPKKLMTPVAASGWLGGAIRIDNASDRLALAEGIESALAVRVATGWPVWATVTAGGLQRIEVPNAVDRVAIYADHDYAGLEAARHAARRLEKAGKDAQIIIPPAEQMDALDWLRAGCFEAAV